MDEQELDLERLMLTVRFLTKTTETLLPIALDHLQTTGIRLCLMRCSYATLPGEGPQLKQYRGKRDLLVVPISLN